MPADAKSEELIAKLPTKRRLNYTCEGSKISILTEDQFLSSRIMSSRPRRIVQILKAIFEQNLTTVRNNNVGHYVKEPS